MHGTRWFAAIMVCAALARASSMVAAEPPLAAAPTAEPVPPLDYADPAEPGRRTGRAGTERFIAKGATPAAANPAVDVFYIHPTTDRGGPDRWNMDPRDPVAAKWVDDSVVARQASAFSGCCRVFAPRYRAATLAALFNPAMRDQAFDLAYGDIERAFDEFLAHDSEGRPFIIAAHSQGSMHAARLLQQRIEGTELQRRLVSAYLVGMNLAEGEFGRRFRYIGICRTPSQTGCAVNGMRCWPAAMWPRRRPVCNPASCSNMAMFPASRPCASIP